LPRKIIIKAAHGCGMHYQVDKDAHKPATVTTGTWEHIGSIKKYLQNIKTKRVERDMKRLCSKWLRTDYCPKTELHYRKVEKGIVFEKYLGADPVCLKFYVINQAVQFICLQQYSVIKKWDIVDKTWNHLSAAINSAAKPSEWQIYPGLYPKPSNLNELLDTVTKLSNLLGKVPLVRIDLYNINNEPYFGEFTFTPSGGWEEPSEDPAWATQVGSSIPFEHDELDFNRDERMEGREQHLTFRHP